MANERPTLKLCEIIEPYQPNRFFLVEVCMTSDGYRSRVCEGTWEKETDAEARRQSLIKTRSS